MFTRTWPRFGTSRNGSSSFPVSVELIFSKILFQFFFQIEKIGMFNRIFTRQTDVSLCIQDLVSWHRTALIELRWSQWDRGRKIHANRPLWMHKKPIEQNWCKMWNWSMKFNEWCNCHSLSMTNCDPGLKIPKPSDWYMLRFTWIITHANELGFYQFRIALLNRLDPSSQFVGTIFEMVRPGPSRGSYESCFFPLRKWAQW